MVYVSAANLQAISAKMFPGASAAMSDSELLHFILTTLAAEKVATFVGLSGASWVLAGLPPATTTQYPSPLGVTGVQPPSLATAKRNKSGPNASLKRKPRGSEPSGTPTPIAT